MISAFYTLGILIAGFMLLLIIDGILYLFSSHFPSLHPHFCKMGWHSNDYDVVSFDGASVHCKCKWCGYEGIVDSQGNLR